jgi:hypothetical protein
VSLTTSVQSHFSLINEILTRISNVPIFTVAIEILRVDLDYCYVAGSVAAVQCKSVDSISTRTIELTLRVLRPANENNLFYSILTVMVTATPK